MEALTMPVIAEAAETPHWDNPVPPHIEEEELDILAFELWHRASAIETETDEDLPTEEETHRGHSSCL